MKQSGFISCICTIIVVIENLNLLQNVNGSKLPVSGVQNERLSSQIAQKYQESAIVGNKARYSKSASTLIPSIADTTAAASTTSAAQASRNNDLWYLEQSVPGPPMPYQFGYEIRDPYGNEQYRKETSDGRAVTGSYGYWGPDGIYRHVDYIADHNGYRANIRTSEPGTANENPASVTINSMPVTGPLPPPSTRRSYPGPSSYPPPSSRSFPSLPPAPPSPSLPLPTQRYNPPQPLPPPTRPTYNQPPAVTRSVESKTSNPKPRPTQPPAPIDWSRKTVITQQKSDTEFRKRTSSSSENDNIPPTPVSVARTSKTLGDENSTNSELNLRTDPVSNPSRPYSFGRGGGDKPRVRLYATGGPLPGIRSADDQKGIHEMYEFIRSELMAREKLHSIERIDDEILRAGVTYAPEQIENSSPPTASSSHQSSHKHRSEIEEHSPVRASHRSLERDDIGPTSNEKEAAIPISTRFMYHFPRMTDTSSVSTQSSLPMEPPRSLPLVSYPPRREQSDPSVTLSAEPPSPSISRHSFSLPSHRPDLTLHNYPSNERKSSPGSRIGDYYQPLPVTRSHLIIHSNDQKSTTEAPRTAFERLAVQEEQNVSRLVSAPMSRKDYTISYPSSYHYASHQFMNLMPRKALPSFHDKNGNNRDERRHQSDHPGNEIKLRATVEVKDQESARVPEVVIGRWIRNENPRIEGAYGDRATSNVPAVDEDISDRKNHDCKEEDIMHRESTSPQTLAPEVSSTTPTTEPSTFSHFLPQAAALVASDPNETSNQPAEPDYMLDDSHETTEALTQDTTTNPSTTAAVTLTESDISSSSSLEEEADEEEDDEEEDNLSEDVKNGLMDLSEEVPTKELPSFHEGTIHNVNMLGNSSAIMGMVADEDTSLEPPADGQEVGDDGNHDARFTAWKRA